MGFAHLHVHTEYSPKDSISKVSDVVAKVAEDGQKAVAITDHGSLGGIWELARAAKTAGITAIPGLEAYLALDASGQPSDRFDHVEMEVAGEGAATDGSGGDGATKKVRYHHLSILATSSTGWSNLIRLHNYAWEDTWYGAPRIDYGMLERYNEGLVVLTGCLGGPVQRPLMQAVLARRRLAGSSDDRAVQSVVEASLAEARRAIEKLIAIFGTERVFVEVMDHGIDGEEEIIGILYGLADEYALACVATGDSHCTHAHEEAAQDAWLAIGSGRKYADPNRWRFSGSGYHVKTEAEMRATRANDARWQEACTNTTLVAGLVDDDVVPEPKRRLPKFPTPPGFSDSTAYFRHRVWEGAKERYGDVLPTQVSERLTWEMDVIESKGFPDYFLITEDVINWCHTDYSPHDWISLKNGQKVDGSRSRKKPIWTGPGRGSAGGSLVSYCLKIIDVDPLEGHLLFERFLTPDSTRMPDIDVDFEYMRRDEVIDFFRIRWGRDNVAQIGTYGTDKSKSALLDAARTLDASSDGAELSSLVPMDGASPMPFSEFADVECGDVGRSFREAITSPVRAQIVALARAIEGVKSNESKHASAVLISAEPLTELIPMRRVEVKNLAGEKEPAWVSRWEGGELEEFGLLKFDALGLRTLDIIHRTVDLLAERGVTVDMASVPIDDLSDERVRRTWQMLGEGRSGSVFQLESTGMRQLLALAKPRRHEDLSTVVALYRPGPMGEGMHTRWANIRAGKEQMSYAHLTTHAEEERVLHSVLGASDGVIVLQEQLMQLAEKIAGFGPFAKSRLQKAVSKKKLADLDYLEPLFKQGGVYEKPDGSVEDIPGGSRAFTLPDGTFSPAFDPATLNVLWKTFKASGEYLFNKAHSYAYGKIAFWTAYLKANWLEDYAAAHLTLSDKAEHRTSMLTELSEQGVEVHPPDVNEAFEDTRNLSGTIVYGIGEAKGVSGKDAAFIVAERHARGLFRSFEDIATRLAPHVSPTCLRILAEAGAFDSLVGRKRMVQLSAAFVTDEKYSAPAFHMHKERVRGDVFDPVEAYTRQRRVLGVALDQLATENETVHTMVAARYMPYPVYRISFLGAFESTSNTAPFFMGIVTDMRVLESRHTSGHFAFLTLSDQDASIEVVVWTGLWERTFPQPSIGDLVVATGRVDRRELADGSSYRQVIAHRVDVHHIGSSTTYPKWHVPDLDRVLSGVGVALEA